MGVTVGLHANPVPDPNEAEYRSSLETFQTFQAFQTLYDVFFDLFFMYVLMLYCFYYYISSNLPIITKPIFFLLIFRFVRVCFSASAISWPENWLTIISGKRLYPRVPYFPGIKVSLLSHRQISLFYEQLSPINIFVILDILSFWFFFFLWNPCIKMARGDMGTCFRSCLPAHFRGVKS